MSVSTGWAAAALVFSTALLPLAAAEQKKTAPDPDEAAVHDYVLTVEKAQHYADVMKKFQQSPPDPAAAAEMQKINQANVYNVEKAAMMEKSPQIMAAFKALNLAPRDFVLIPLAVQTASFAASAPNNGGAAFAYVNPANIAFVKAHKADLEKWGLQ
jgi:hypothetical protein